MEGRLDPAPAGQLGARCLFGEGEGLALGWTRWLRLVGLRTLPSYGVVQVGESVADGRSLPAAALVVLAAWTVAAGALGALAWRRVLAR